MSAHPWDEWAAARGVRRRPAALAVQDYEGPGDPEPLWVHGDGCLTPVGDGRRMYPICGHGQRATFVGYRDDGYVLGEDAAMPVEKRTAVLRSASGSPDSFDAERAGPFGCDPCCGCRRRPAEGELVWQNRYGDLYCDRCAARRRLEV